MDTGNRSKKGSIGSKEVADVLKSAISKGELKLSQRLVEAQLCDRFGVKRNTIREALRRLEHDGFVKITRHVGAFVAEFSRGDIEQIYDILSVLDGLAVRLATPFITAEQIGRLEGLLEQMEAADKPAAIYDLNHEFHALLCEWSENRRLIDLINNLRLSLETFSFRSFYAPGQIAASHSEHRQLLQAIKESDPIKAENILRVHLIDTKNRVIKWVYRSL
jgi:DNA-binding GntR family transcriptional regulator